MYEKIHMFECECLLKFATKMSTLVAIKELHFGGCKSFKEIMKGLESFTCLKKLYMTKCEALKNFEQEFPRMWLEGIPFWWMQILKLFGKD